MYKKNKDYIINIRVSRETYEDIKQKAKETSESISGVIRKIIKEGGDIVNGLSNDFSRSNFNRASIESYQEAMAAQEIICAKCGGKVKKDSKVTIAYTRQGRHYVLCYKCK